MSQASSRKRARLTRPAAEQARKKFQVPTQPKKQKTICGKWFIKTICHNLSGQIVATRPPNNVQWKDWPALHGKRGGLAAAARQKPRYLYMPATEACPIERLPLEILQQIARHLLPTGGIFHTFLQDEALPDDYSVTPARQSKVQWRIIHHLTPHSAHQHRFLPNATVFVQEHLCALAYTSRRLNAVFNSVLYGENQWVVDLAAWYSETVNIWVPPPAGANFHWDERLSASLNPMLPTGHSTAVSLESVPAARTPGWPLSPRTAAYVRDLVIAGAVQTTLQLMLAQNADSVEGNKAPLAQSAESAERNGALLARLAAVVDLFVGAAATTTSPPQPQPQQQSRPQHALRHVLVYLSEAQYTQGWYVDGIEGVDEGACGDRIRIVPSEQTPNDRRGMFPSSERYWDPVRRLCGIKGQVSVRGMLTDELAQELQDIMKCDAAISP